MAAAGAIPSVISRGSIEISRRLIDASVHDERLTYLYIPPAVSSVWLSHALICARAREREFVRQLGEC